MTLEQATNAVLVAIEAEDLGALAHALAARAEALRATPQPSVAALEGGERACAALAALKQRWAREEARLHQVQAGFVEQAQEASLVLHG